MKRTLLLSSQCQCLSTNNVKTCAELAALEQTNILTTLSQLHQTYPSRQGLWSQTRWDAIHFLLWHKKSQVSGQISEVSPTGEETKYQIKALFCNIFSNLNTLLSYFIDSTLSVKLAILIVVQGRCPDTTPIVEQLFRLYFQNIFQPVKG